MKENHYLYKLLALFMVVILASIYLFANTNFSIQHTNVLKDFLFEGASDKTTITQYFSGNSDYVGGAGLTLNEEVQLSHVEVTCEDGSKIKHNIEAKDTNNYTLNVVKKAELSKPEKITLYVDNEVYDEVLLSKTNEQLYYFADENQSYRHIYINDAGVFLGEFYLKELPEDIKQNVIFEFCHKDDSTSTGYHVFAKKMIGLYDLTVGKDLGFVPFVKGERFDSEKDVYVIISFSNTNVIEMPLIKGAN